MAQRWKHTFLFVKWDEYHGTRGNWTCDVDGEKLVGWPQVLEWVDKGQHELISAVPERSKLTYGPPVGGLNSPSNGDEVDGYRLFLKRPA